MVGRRKTFVKGKAESSDVLECVKSLITHVHTIYIEFMIPTMIIFLGKCLPTAIAHALVKKLIS
jgi:uncharacterized membrane protein YesL